jgi:hypothetical protein
VINHAKRNHNQLHVAFLDLAKAFDTVSHKHLVAGLRRFRCPNQFIDIVEDLYADISTYFQYDEGKTKMIPMTRGVKQGDPLSLYCLTSPWIPYLKVLIDKITVINLDLMIRITSHSAMLTTMPSLQAA